MRYEDFRVAFSVSPAQAQTKPGPKVMKDCEVVNATYDSVRYFLYRQAPLSKNIIIWA